jgi:hypothetical protein
VTIDTGQPWVTVLSDAATASPLGFFAEAGASSTGSCLTSVVRWDLLRTAGTGLKPTDRPPSTAQPARS